MSTQVIEIPLQQIHEAPWNPRQFFDEKKLAELAESIRTKGVMEPALVRETARPGHYELIAGARRHRASKLAAIATLPCLVRELDDAQALEFAIVENSQREDVNAIEEAQGYQALQKSNAKLYTVAEIASRVGKAESYVYRRLKLLTLEEHFQDALAEGRLSLGHAEALCRLTPAQRRVALDDSLVWRDSPLLRDPGADPDDEVGVENTAADLAPLHQLLDFIRTRTHFNPVAEDTRHFQPELMQQLVEKRADDLEENADAPMTSQLIELSADPMVKMRLGAKEGDPIPLSPSKWAEVTGPKDRCAFVTRGVITHGGAARVLDVCTNKKCAKHFDQPKPKPAAGASAGKSATKPAGKDKYQIERERHQAEAEAWRALVPHAHKALVEYLKAQKLDLRVVLEMLIDSDVLRHYGVTLTVNNLPLCAALGVIGTDHWNREVFLRTVKPFKFNLGPVEQQLRQAQKAAAASAPAKTKKAKGK